MVGITFETSPLISICSFIILSSIFFSSSSTTIAAAQELSRDGEEIFVHPSPKHQHHHRYIPVLFTGPFNRRSIPLSAAAAAAVATSSEEQHPQSSSPYINEDGGEGDSNNEDDGYVVQKLFSHSNSNNNLQQQHQQQQRTNGAPLYPVVFSRKPNKVWAPHNLRVEHHQSFGNAMKQILMRMNYQV